jgi:hypothetical protein
VTTAEHIRDVVRRVERLVLEKSAQYGDSALEPVRVFSRSDPVEQLKVRIDDKLARVVRGRAGADDEDAVVDLIGYLILLLVAQERSRGKTRPTSPTATTPSGEHRR